MGKHRRVARYGVGIVADVPSEYVEETEEEDQGQILRKKLDHCYKFYSNVVCSCFMWFPKTVWTMCYSRPNMKPVGVCRKLRRLCFTRPTELPKSLLSLIYIIRCVVAEKK